MNKMNQSQTRSPRKRLLSLILAVILMIGLLPISAFATSASAQAGEDKAATQDSEFLRIFHLDCGRKYFTVSEIKGIIDQLAENHYTHIQLAFGNDGLRFLLNNMSVTVNGTEYESDAVKTAIQSGNSGNGLAGAAAGVRGAALRTGLPACLQPAALPRAAELPVSQILHTEGDLFPCRSNAK